MLKSPVMTTSHWLTEGCSRMSSSDCMKSMLLESGELYIVPIMIGLRFVLILTQDESIVGLNTSSNWDSGVHCSPNL